MPGQTPPPLPPNPSPPSSPWRHLWHRRADYGFEYSDEEAEEEDVDIENQYYNSKGAAALPHLGTSPSCTSGTLWTMCAFCAALLEGDNAKEALVGFGQVLKMETEQGEW